MIDRKSVIASPTEEEEEEEAVEKEEEEAYNGAAVVSETRMHARNSDTECAHYYFIPTDYRSNATLLIARSIEDALN